VKELHKLQQQLQHRTHTYLYQIDGLLQAARDAVTALNTQIAAGAAAAGNPLSALLKLCPQRQQQQQDEGGVQASAAAPQAAEALHGICCTIWVSQLVSLLQYGSCHAQHLPPCVFCSDFGTATSGFVHGLLQIRAWGFSCKFECSPARVDLISCPNITCRKSS
jgi:hypothetical protein